MEYANLKLVDRELEDQTAVHAQSPMPRPELYKPGAAFDADRHSLDGEVLHYLLRSLGTPPLRIELWNGDVVMPDDGIYVATAKIANRLTLGKLFLDPEYQFGECYSDGSMEFEGDMVAFFAALFPLLDAGERRGTKLFEMFRRRGSNSQSGSRENIHHHYDVGNAFYKLWLDRELAYTCAYFPTPDTSLEAAQIAKMDHICKKLRLRMGETVVEAGCGWGALALHMAKHYGVNVRAYNISREQLAYARERASKEGLTGRVEFIEDDYRDISGSCDAFVSVGMLEHVGCENYGAFSQVIDRVLTPSGRGLIHSIGLNRPAPLNPWIEKRIFPGAQPPSIRDMMEIFEIDSFAVLDVENLRQHYALTLAHWLKRFEDASGEIRDMYDERFVRMWRVYLAGSEAAFRAGSLQLFQVLFAREHCHDLAWTRAHLYQA